MRNRAIAAGIAFLVVFFGLMSVVGNVHVAEFYGCLGLGAIAAIITFFKYPKPNQSSD